MNHILLVALLLLLLNIDVTYSVVRCSQGVTVNCQNNAANYARCWHSCHLRHRSYSCPQHYSKNLFANQPYVGIENGHEGGPSCTRSKRWRGCNLEDDLVPILNGLCSNRGNGDYDVTHQAVNAPIEAVRQALIGRALEASGMTARQGSYGGVYTTIYSDVYIV